MRLPGLIGGFELPTPEELEELQRRAAEGDREAQAEIDRLYGTEGIVVDDPGATISVDILREMLQTWLQELTKILEGE